MDVEESLERALADLAIVESAYEEEIRVGDSSGGSGCDNDNNSVADRNDNFPLRFTLRLSSSNDAENDNNNDEEAALVTLEYVKGYPKSTGVQIVSYRVRLPKYKSRLDETVAALRKTALECLEDEMEGGLACIQTALDVWNDYLNMMDDNNSNTIDNHAGAVPSAGEDAVGGSTAKVSSSRIHHWITGKPLVDRKSTFQAHVCQVFAEHEVGEALQQLLQSNSKLQKATHNMFAYRLTEELADGTMILKHDNDDDGEDAAGARLAHLLEMRKEDCIFVVVSRWYGGIKLGPKRFAHINNVARELLQDCHDKRLLNRPREISAPATTTS